MKGMTFGLEEGGDGDLVGGVEGDGRFAPAAAAS